MFSRTIFFSRRSRRVSKERPKTATLPHPQVLDETLKDKVAILDQVCWYQGLTVTQYPPATRCYFCYLTWPNSVLKIAGNPKYGITRYLGIPDISINPKYRVIPLIPEIPGNTQKTRPKPAWYWKKTTRQALTGIFSNISKTRWPFRHRKYLSQPSQLAIVYFLLSSWCLFLQRECQILACYGQFWLFCREFTHYLV